MLINLVEVGIERVSLSLSPYAVPELEWRGYRRHSIIVHGMAVWE